MCAAGVHVLVSEGVKMFTSAARLSASPSVWRRRWIILLPASLLTLPDTFPLFQCCRKKHGDTAEHYSGLKSACFACTTLGGKWLTVWICHFAREGGVLFCQGAPLHYYSTWRSWKWQCDVKGIIRSWMYSGCVPTPPSARVACLFHFHRPLNHKCLFVNKKVMVP